MDGCLAGVVADRICLVERTAPGGRGSAASLPALVAEALHAAGLRATTLDGIAVTVGPGSFTGVRAALALAQGIALAARLPLHGVSTGDAIRAAAAITRPLWIAINSKRDRVFLDIGETIAALSLDDLPLPPAPIAVAGDAAEMVARRLSARGIDVQVLNQPCCSLGIALAARNTPRPALPLYIDAVAARPNTARPAPAFLDPG